MKKSKKQLNRKKSISDSDILDLPVLTKLPPPSRRLSVEEYYRFVKMGLRWIDRKADRQRRQSNTITKPFELKS